MTAKIYTAFRDLILDLGRFDAAHELAELSLRHLFNSLDSNEQTDDQVAALAARYGLHVRAESPQKAHREIAMAGICSANATYENFLTQMCAEFSIFHNIHIDFSMLKKGETKHDHFAKKLTPPLTEEYRLLSCSMEMIRLIRNEHIHRNTKNLDKRIAELRCRILSSETRMDVFGSRSAPQDFDVIGYTDFLFFTHAVRCMAEHWCVNFLPSHSAIATHPETKAFIRESGHAKLNQFLRGRFSLDPTDSAMVCKIV